MPVRRKRSAATLRRRRVNRNTRRKARTTRRTPRARVLRPTKVGRTKALGSIFPDCYRAKLRYGVLYNLTGGTRNTVVIRGNSVFDPEYATGGYQPYGFDRLAEVYGQYYVHSSAVTVQFIPHATISQTNKAGDIDVAASICECGVYPALSPGDIAISSSRIVDVTQYPGYRGKTTYPNSKPIYVKNYSSTQKMMGYKAFPEGNFRAVVASNPAQQWYWNICANSYDLGTSNAKIYMRIVVTYYVSFFNRQEIYLRDDDEAVDPE